MNLWPTEPFEYPEKPLDRGKVLSAEQLNEIEELGALRGRGRRWYRLAHTARHQSSARRLLHARHRPQRAASLQRTPRRLVQDLERLYTQARHRAHAGAGARHRRGRGRRDRHHRLWHQRSGDSGSARSAGEEGIKTSYLRAARAAAGRHVDRIHQEASRASMWWRTTTKARCTTDSTARAGIRHAVRLACAEMRRPAARARAGSPKRSWNRNGRRRN